MKAEKNSITALLSIALVSQLPISHAALFTSVIQTKNGPIQGAAAFSQAPSNLAHLSNWADIAVWKGIPFAASTEGQNRWKPPQPVNGWNGTLNATNFGPACPASTEDTSVTVSEDCLSVNVWSAANSSDAKLPVVMWSYPAYSYSGDTAFDGAGFADKGIVYVNYNYRTGSFGWLAHPELSEERFAETSRNSSGNYGILDQFAALQWIRDNIEAFGGDPDHITVMGQSAGSAATQHILNSPLTAGQFVGAIIESGVRDPHDPLCASLAENYVTLDFGLQQGVEYIASKNISTIADARALKMDVLLDSVKTSGDTSAEWTFTATLDYYIMPDTYYNTLVDGLANDVPIITGNTRDESGATFGLNITVSEYLEDLNSTYDETFREAFLALYPAANDSQASLSENLQFTDRSMVGTWLWAELWRNGGSQSPVYTYLWDHAPPGQTEGAYHMSEIPYVHNNLYAVNGSYLDYKEDDWAIAVTMNDYWVNFIKSGNPNGAGLVEWPVANSKPITQELGDSFGNMSIGTCSQLSLFRQWFDTLPTY